MCPRRTRTAGTPLAPSIQPTWHLRQNSIGIDQHKPHHHRGGPTLATANTTLEPLWALNDICNTDEELLLGALDPIELTELAELDWDAVISPLEV
ncbi:hypothetical protein PF008_g32390, partial [Phytophthora fragariae]